MILLIYLKFIMFVKYSGLNGESVSALFQDWLQVWGTKSLCMLWPPEVLVHHQLSWCIAKKRVRLIDLHTSPKLITQLFPAILNIEIWKMISNCTQSSSSLCLIVCVSEPVSGPNLSILEHGATRIQIQWDELPVSQQRGFITNYTMYSRTLESSSTELRGKQLYCVLFVFVCLLCENIPETI